MSGLPDSPLVAMLYLISAVLFILGLKGLTRVRSARRGNLMSAGAMLVAIVATLIEMGTVDYRWILGGLVVGGGLGAIAAVRVPMTSMPEMVALFNGCGGIASALVAAAVVSLKVIEPGSPETMAVEAGSAEALTTVLSILIGAVTFSGSLVAWGKLNGNLPGRPVLLPGRHLINALLILTAVGVGVWFTFSAAGAEEVILGLVVVAAASLVLGVLLVIPIGGADMPVVISLLNSYSGLAAAATGFVLANNVLIISGALVGASGLILTQIMCKAMNRSLANVLFGGFGSDEGSGTKSGGGAEEYGQVRSYSAEEAAMVLEAAERVVVVPGYGLAVAQAQHAVREMADLLEAHGTKVTYAIHPVAGRMPGHMNVLLAEADIPYEQLLEMERVNPEFKNTDVALVVGANDVVNPAATDEPDSPIYGMPVLEVWNAQSVIVIKRSLSPGFAGIKNPLFEADNTMMLFADAKAALQDIVAELKEAIAA